MFFQLAVGAMDSVTGVLLVVAPIFTLRMMSVKEEVASSLMVSWVGVFVLSVGLSYFFVRRVPVDVEGLLEERPVLFGNRRQGPDLLQVGLRRSRMWLELKLRDPQALHDRSAMPGYGYLFEDGRGEDLVAFLSRTRAGDFEERLKTIGSWVPIVVEADGLSGKGLFERSCSACHGVEGRGDGVLAKAFLRPPASLVEGPFVHTLGEPGDELRLRVARVVKFGIPGTDMSGRELLEDGEVLTLADWVMGLRE